MTILAIFALLTFIGLWRWMKIDQLAFDVYWIKKEYSQRNGKEAYFFQDLPRVKAMFSRKKVKLHSWYTDVQLKEIQE